jgi:hypothetical protein
MSKSSSKFPFELNLESLQSEYVITFYRLHDPREKQRRIDEMVQEE